MKHLALRIELLEDLHIGTGTGWGDIDALQVRDREGKPVLPASHIKGLWRDAAHEWRRFDPAAVTEHDIATLFGRPGSGQGKLQLTSAYLCAQTPVMPIIWGSTEIDDTGKAAEKSLRFIEYIPAGSRFEMEVALPAHYEALLTGILARCHRLGGGRNRGHGRVRWQLRASPPPEPWQCPEPPALPGRLRLLLRNPDPVCLARTGHPGNLIASEVFLRGRSLRGAWVAACLALEQDEVAHHLLTDTLSWGDALPLPADLQLADAQQALSALEVLPIPLSIGTPKASAPPGELPAWVYRREGDLFGARGEIDQMQPGQHPGQKLKRPASGEFLFRLKPDTPWRRYRPQLLERLHTRVPDEENRHEQALFSTEELAERTLFLADLIVTTPVQAQALGAALRALTGYWLRIGRGGRPLVIEAAAWLPLPTHGNATGPDFTLLLESDLIVRDPLGNFRDRLDAQTLAELAGLPAEASPMLTTEAVFSEGCERFGFNALTGLPRLAQRAILAGSVIRVGGAAAPRLREALAQRLALGESPEEGFGRFRIDRLPTVQPVGEARPQPAKTTESSEEKLCVEAKERISRFGERALTAPSPSQWGEFRARVQAARSREELQKAFDLIETAAQKHGGKAWQSFIQSEDYAELRRHLATLELAQAQKLLEYFLRWQRVMAQPQEA